jgi:hypothetical protein
MNVTNKKKVVIQRYIKCIGSKAFIVRTCWRKKGNSYCFVITNKSSYYDYDNTPELTKYLVNPKSYGTTTIVEAKSGKHLDETLPFVQNIVKFLKIRAQAKFSEFVCDFIKDESGIWWLINIKAFILDREVYLENIKRLTNWDDEDPDMVKGEKPVDYQNTGKCGYCEEIFDREDLNKKLTYKMIIQMDKHFYHRGKDYDWLDRSEFKYLDLSNLYLTHYVCTTCYKLYQEMKELVDTYEEFSKYIGVQMALDKSGELVSITSLKKPPQELLDANKAGVKIGGNEDKIQDCEHGHDGRPTQTRESI